MKKNLSPSDPRNLPTKSLRVLGIEWSHSMPATKKYRQGQIRAAKRRNMSLSDALEATESVAQAMRSARKTRVANIIVARTGHNLPYRPTPKKALPTKEGRVDRLDKLRRDAVLASFRGCHRYPYDDHGQEFCKLTTDPAQVGVSQSQHEDWGGKGKWSVTITDTTITVPTDWRVRVERRGLDMLDGMMTLDAAPMDGAPAGVSLYAATWLVQGRGYTVTAEKGYIAIQGETSYHGATATKALAGLRRKVESAAWKAQVKTADLDHLVSRAGEIKVCVSDAKAIGACEYGIRSWCHAVGLDYEAGCATVTEVYAAYQREPRSEARAAILYAIRRRGRKLAA